MEEEYGTYEYEKYIGIKKDHINFWYRQYNCLITSHVLSLANECYGIFFHNHP